MSTVSKGLRLGIDLGGTSVKLAVVDSRHRIISQASVDSSGFLMPNKLVKKITAEAQGLMAGKKVDSVGVGVAGDIDFHKGLVRISPNLGWKNVPLKKMIQAVLKKPVAVDNDANAAAWGLYKTQCSSSAKNVMAVTLGTGVGGGLILNGQLYRGSTGSAGEIGHITMDENGPLCNCGNRGCLESFCGAIHITKRAKDRLALGGRSLLQKEFKLNPDNITPLALAQAAHKKDAFSLSVWNDVGHKLGLCLGNLIYVLNLDVILLTGGVAQAGKLILDPMWKILRTRTFKTPMNAVKIKVAADAAHMGVVGAALL